MRSVCVLYEDQAGQQIEGFGLHRLVVACSADSGIAARWEIERAVVPYPAKGNAKLREKCRDTREFSRLAAHGVVIAVYDRDKLHHLPDIGALTPRGARRPCRRETLDKLFEGTSARRLRIVLLEENTETLIEALRRLEPGLATPETFTHALAKVARGEGRTSRDRILNAAASDAPGRQDLRVRLLAEVPSFARLLREVLAGLRDLP